ncbi:MAG: GTPase Era [Lentisphaerae bacterium]|nr:GTPase Era [Lentisphaerota bacterium]
MHDTRQPPREPPTRTAVVGIVGRTNSGKSTLVNTLVGEKVSIVSPVAQTTRNTIRAVLDEPRGQLVLVDTPGLHKAEGPLGTLLNRMARHAAANVDVLLLVMDGSQAPRLEDDGWMRRLLFADQPCLFILNKADREDSHEAAFRQLWETIQEDKQRQRDIPWFSISAATGDGVPAVVDALFAGAQPGERPYDREMLSDYPRRLVIADIIRESYLRHLRDELPHELGIRVDELREHPGEWRVEATVFVNRPSQKPIVIGPKGRTIHQVREAAEQEASRQFDIKVTLSLWVKIEKNWMTNFWLLKQMGYAGGHQG